MRCSVVVRAYNEAKHLGKLLEGITRQTEKEVEIILVDSGSIDATIQIAESHGARIVYIRPEEFTFGRSLNLGIETATHELVVIASAHVYPVYPDWLECLLRPFADETVAVVYGKQRGAKISNFSEGEIFQQWFPDEEVVHQPGPFCNNANAAIRKSLWIAHPYDESLTGLEDIAWAKWAQSQSWTVVYAAQAEVIHIHHETRQAVFDRYRREAMAFKRIFPESHFSLYDFMRLSATNILSDLSHARHEGVLWNNLASIFWFRGLQFWGTYQGYRHSSPVTKQLRERFYYPRGMEAGEASERDIEPIRYNQGGRGKG
jgi:glycosyltransferase involved in cell wall biosynthesis